MHQSPDHLDPAAVESVAVRQWIRHGLACALPSPEQPPAVTATMSGYAVAAGQRAVRVAPAPIEAAATLDTGWCVIAHAHVLTAR